MDYRKYRLETSLIHTGYRSGEHHDSLTVPLYQTSTYTFPSAEEGARRFAGESGGNIYSRLGNPTVRVLEERLASLEGGEAALAFSSGMSAVSAVLIHLTRAGDHILCSRGIYGCTFGLLELMEEKYDITHDLISMVSAEEVEQAIKPDTACIYVETPINPTMELVDLKVIAAIARKHEIPFVVDNTFCSPYIQNPIEAGADYVIHSATKYLNGHGDVVAGIVVGKNRDEMESIRSHVQKDIGGIMSPFDAWLILRGLKTLPVRMDRHTSNAETVCRFLKEQRAVKTLFYPFDADHPQAAIARRQMRSGGGVISFELEGGTEDAQAFMNALSLIKIAVSLGDAETLIQHPATMTHAGVPADQRRKMGITDSLLRLSVGLEHPDDLLSDLQEAFQKIAAGHAEQH